MTLLLPTRRATRALQEAFLQAAGGAALLLPKIRPIIGSGEEPTLLSERARPRDRRRRARCGRPIGEIERQLALAKLVLRWSEAERGGSGPEADIAAYGRRPPARRRRPPGWRASSPG